MKKNIVLLLLLASKISAYRIQIKNEMDGPLVVNITEHNITTQRYIRPNEYFDYVTAGCYMLQMIVNSGRAVGQTAFAGNMFNKSCKDYKAIARFLISPVWDPVTGKENLNPAIMEVREEE